jgi:hypothetical protein
MYRIISRLTIAASCLWFVAPGPMPVAYDQPQPSAEQSKDTKSPKAVAERVLGGNGRVCDAAVLPVGSASVPIILASVDVSGRFCNELLLVRASEPPSVLQSIEAWGVDDLSKVLRDLDQDGELELVVPRMFSSYEGTAACVATKSTVLKCSSGSCADVSARYDRFYATELDELQHRIALAQGRGPEADEQLPCLTMESDRLRRVLGIDPRAGLDVKVKHVVHHAALGSRDHGGS